MPNTSATGGYLLPTSAPPAEDDALDDIFTELISGLTGFDRDTRVRPRWQPTQSSLPSRDVNWCAVGVTEDEPDDNAVITHNPTADSGNGQDDLQRHEEIQVLATFYGPNAKGYAKQVRDGLSIPQNRETLQLSDLTFVKTGRIRAVPEQMNNVWQRRYDLPIFFRRRVARSYAIQTIQSVGVELHVDSRVIQINVP
jgi:hypothetical protein